jgi:hypothetical protein
MAIAATRPTEDGERVVWRPLRGAQEAFLECPVFEILYDGERFCAKTEAMLMKFATHCGQGWGEDWKGIIFRRTYPELAEVVTRSIELFRQFYPTAKFRESGREGLSWRFPDGEILKFRYALRRMDIEALLGHQFTFMGWEELTSWSDATLYEPLMACCRSTRKGIPLHVVSNTNPWGPGHGWVRERFVDPMPERSVLRFRYTSPIDGSEIVLRRCRIHGMMRENQPAMEANPQYVAQIMSIKDPNIRKAWLEGSWDIQAGGRFTDSWKDELHFIQPFPIPDGWTVDRAFDWGSSAPFAVGWFAESNGEPFEKPITIAGREVSRVPRGTLFMIAEWYGWNGVPNTGIKLRPSLIAEGVREREEQMRGHLLNGHYVAPGPADASIFDVDTEGESIATKMEMSGVSWERSVKRKGSRVNGWELMIERLEAAHPLLDGQPMEEPGLFVFDTCHQFRRTLAAAPRDDKNPDDVDTNSEDHALDMARYRILADGPAVFTTTLDRRG